ncbi:phytanoyl-CoA dioxygenase family protein [Sphingobium boeckii]|uniref:Ectoine hydroxylase-related dioxygenase (Phytanoyl-CoA dioxygenase family) n=1 Tax=Sphingobium boeckii TaxID=1082345 RepID=A0A7W9AGN6_9SPHN|nr:phytanoyl-CoA dioxygenase family protein [Sphingobium boeckii]MBB5685228.1 ectoine hydroxylase-related dioxygenase (phytanoyl-CoA dioxygenase family) [Sphingobium boeckii]
MTEISDRERHSFIKDGAQHLRAGVTAHLAQLHSIFSDLPEGHAGVRLNGLEKLKPLLSNNGPIGSIAAHILGQTCRPVRAIMFDNTTEANWSLAWHQDRTICVRLRIEIAEFGPWTTKAGMQHVEPPFDLIARMLTLRVHLDDVSANNASLLIALGSHRRGRVPIDMIDAVVHQSGIRKCFAEAGDVWLYSTPILHASDRAKNPSRRRVLQVDFSADSLPGCLEWLGV